MENSNLLLTTRLCVYITEKAVLTSFLEEKTEAQENEETCENSYKWEVDSQAKIQRPISIT